MEDSEARGEGLTSEGERRGGMQAMRVGPRRQPWPLPAMGSREPVRDRHPSSQDP